MTDLVTLAARDQGNGQISFHQYTANDLAETFSPAEIKALHRGENVRKVGRRTGVIVWVSANALAISALLPGSDNEMRRCAKLDPAEA